MKRSLNPRPENTTGWGACPDFREHYRLGTSTFFWKPRDDPDPDPDYRLGHHQTGPPLFLKSHGLLRSGVFSAFWIQTAPGCVVSLPNSVFSVLFFVFYFFFLFEPPPPPGLDLGAQSRNRFDTTQWDTSHYLVVAF